MFDQLQQAYFDLLMPAREGLHSQNHRRPTTGQCNNCPSQDQPFSLKLDASILIHFSILVSDMLSHDVYPTSDPHLSFLKC
jgi:hypothetical protein